jgi:NADP-reducing hydrogenase subunit HndC
MVDIARYFLDFTQQESCGKCPSCRLGTKQMVQILSRITEGNGEYRDLEVLEEISENIKASSLCGLGQTAANPVLTTIKYFRDEYLAHIKEKRCPALVCKSLISYVIDPELCSGCTVCAKNCPSDAITGEPKGIYTIDQKKCIKCGICLTVCPPKFKAVKKVSPPVK